MIIELEVDGNQYTNFVSASVQVRLDALSNTFNFETVSEDGNPLPFTGGEPCRVSVDGEVVLTGNIEVVDVGYSAGSHSISISGRDKTGDLLDSTLGIISDLSAPITLKTIIEKVISNLGLDISVDSEINVPPFEKAEDIISPDPGQNAFQFLEKYSRKANVILTSSGEGNVVISSPQGRTVDATIRHEVGGQSNDIMEANVSYDTTGRYNIYKFVSSLNPTALVAAGLLPLDDLVDQKGETIDSSIRAGRQLVLVAETPFSNTSNEARAKWEANIRQARGRVYSATVSGFRNTSNSLWEINTLVSIIDNFCSINDRMLINSISFNYSLGTGSQTTLGFVEKDAYTLSLSEPKEETLGAGLFGTT